MGIQRLALCAGQAKSPQVFSKTRCVKPTETALCGGSHGAEYFLKETPPFPNQSESLKYSRTCLAGTSPPPPGQRGHRKRPLLPPIKKETRNSPSSGKRDGQRCSFRRHFSLGQPRREPKGWQLARRGVSALQVPCSWSPEGDFRRGLAECSSLVFQASAGFPQFAAVRSVSKQLPSSMGMGHKINHQRTAGFIAACCLPLGIQSMMLLFFHANLEGELLVHCLGDYSQARTSINLPPNISL